MTEPQTPRWLRRAGGMLLLLLLLAAALAGAVVALPPLAQPLHYHDFADQRAFFGVPNFLNVVSNLAFLLVAASGLGVLRRAGGAVFVERAERLPYALFFLTLAATSLGSAYYHLAPDNARLFWDRLPMSVGFTTLLAAVIAERLSVRAGLVLLAPLVLAGAATVVYWRLSAAMGEENVLPYFALQAYAIVAVLLLIGLCPSRYSHGGHLLLAVALYGAALGAEWFDRQLFAFGQVVSAHTAKHLLAALAVYQVTRMLRARTSA